MKGQKGFVMSRVMIALGWALALCVFVAPSSAFAQGPKIGYVDLQKALNEVSEGKKAKKKLKADFDKKQKALNKQQEELKTMQKDLEQNGMMLSDEAKRAKAMEFQKKMYELQQTYGKMQGELAQAEAKATKKIFDKMGVIISEIAKEKGYDLVLERTESAILFAADGMDLTGELIKRYNAAN